eukprot:GHVQ01043353.1.p1 GENE.GHVQ01043353.1~~GHVQ01043353.1.p1  ORF type:complete len:763 (+),score=81.25 GHVQ01043353.1:68-2356(+)
MVLTQHLLRIHGLAGIELIGGAIMETPRTLSKVMPGSSYMQAVHNVRQAHNKSRKSPESGVRSSNVGESKPLWVPSRERIEQSKLWQFMQLVNDQEMKPGGNNGDRLLRYRDLHRWSVSQRTQFWIAVWRFTNMIPSLTDLTSVAVDNVRQPSIAGTTRERNIEADYEDMAHYQFFPNQPLNFAENLLRRRRYPDAPCLIFNGECTVERSLTYRQLYMQTAQLCAALRQVDSIKRGDRAVGIVCNTPEAVVAMLATTAAGGIWSSCSPDFGVDSIVDRLGQVEPTVLFVTDYYIFKGRRIPCIKKALEVMERIPSVRRLIVLPYGNGAEDDETLVHDVQERCGGKILAVNHYVARFSHVNEITYAETDFNDPLFILFSSGTTGLPKCIVHRQGLLLQLVKEHQLHLDIKPGDRVFYFTTCAWMMWNWLVAALASDCCLLLYDGNPLYPSMDVLWKFANSQGCTMFGTSAKFIDWLKKEGFDAAELGYKLETLRTITSTGSPLSAESFEYVYEHIKNDVHLVSMSGGTDICSCFVSGDPTSAVWGGEIQDRALGMAVHVFDELGRAVWQEKGELVCTAPFVAQPLGFWVDDSSQTKYRKTYFSMYKGVWQQGDLAEITGNGGIVIHGRSDTVLNPGGVRLGTAEIYRQVEKVTEIEEAVVVGRDVEDDVRVVLFVKTRNDVPLSEDLTSTIVKTIRQGASPRHVPSEIYKVTAIPKTRTGKIVEVAVRNVLNNVPVSNLGALENPDSLEQYKQFAQKHPQSKL